MESTTGWVDVDDFPEDLTKMPEYSTAERNSMAHQAVSESNGSLSLRKAHRVFGAAYSTIHGRVKLN